MRYNHVSRIIIITVLSYFKNTGISLSCILFFSIKCALIKMIDSEIPSSLFCLRGSRTNRTLVRATGEDHSFADNFSAAEIILLAKMGKQKLREAIFSVRCSRRFFSRPQKWAEKRSEFLAHHGPKRGATKLSAGAFYLCTSRSDVKGAKTFTLCQRVTETPAKSRL